MRIENTVNRDLSDFNDETGRRENNRGGGGEDDETSETLPVAQEAPDLVGEICRVTWRHCRIAVVSGVGLELM
jgi:hypothetical protein